MVFRRGENITKQGAFASYVIFIVSGFSRQYIECSNGRDYNLRIITPGEMTGLSAVFNRNTFNYSVVAITETTGFLIEKDAIAGLVKKNGAFAFGIISRYCEHNSRLYTSLDQRAPPADQREDGDGPADTGARELRRRGSFQASLKA
ncbi:MAG: Crp/Fnr family transcriptional regulator [Marinilabiliales bacterium]|nr:Crp/Fnr family transcriptional regulator [Marinilabiliales bacterium]